MTKTSGTEIEGVLHTFTPFDESSSSLPAEKRNMYVIRAAKFISSPVGTDSSERIEDGSTVLAPASKVQSVHIKSFRLNLAKKDVSNGDTALRTDADISTASANNNNNEKVLVAAGTAWTSQGDTKRIVAPTPAAGSNNINWRQRTTPPPLGAYASAVRASSNTARSGPPMDEGLQGNIGVWDQFQANERLFNVKATFDENHYTIALDKSAIPTHMQQHAERLAREIEGQVSENIHIAEERGQKAAADFDEEDMYSGVLRKAEEANVNKENDTAPLSSAPPGLAAPSTVDQSAPEKSGSQTSPADHISAKLEPTQLLNDKTASTVPPSPEEVNKEKSDIEASESENVTSVPTPSTTSQRDVKKTVTSSTSEYAEEDQEKKPVVKSKLNPSAKEFTFNPSAKSFTPSRTFVASPTADVAPTPGIPTAPVPIPYMQAPHMHPGMMQGMPPGPHMVMGTPQYMQQPMVPPQGSGQGDSTGSAPTPDGQANTAQQQQLMPPPHYMMAAPGVFYAQYRPPGAGPYPMAGGPQMPVSDLCSFFRVQSRLSVDSYIHPPITDSGTCILFLLLIFRF